MRRLAGVFVVVSCIATACGDGEGGNNTNQGLCGNGLAENQEECDGADLRSQTCETLGYGTGFLGCRANCEFYTEGCQPPATCGNGTVDPPEECDGGDLDGATCERLGYPGGVLGCTPQCTYHTDGCDRPDTCGNGILDTPEECDGADLGSSSCESLGFMGGTLSCDQDCTLNTDACRDLVGYVMVLQTGNSASISASFNPKPVTDPLYRQIALDSCVETLDTGDPDPTQNKDAGTIVLTGGEVDPVTLTPTGPYHEYQDDLTSTPTTLLIPGFTLTFTGFGGADEGPFAGSVVGPQFMDSVSHVPAVLSGGFDRTQSLRFSWSPGGAQDVWIVLHENTNPGRAAVCRTADDGSFEVPASVMSGFVGDTPGHLIVIRRSESIAIDTNGSQVLLMVQNTHGEFVGLP